MALLRKSVRIIIPPPPLAQAGVFLCARSVMVEHPGASSQTRRGKGKPTPAWGYTWAGVFLSGTQLSRNLRQLPQTGKP